MSSRRPSHRDSSSLRVAGLIHIARAAAGVATIGSGVCAVWHRDAQWLVVAGICVLVWAVFALLHAFEATRLRCALCTGTLFSSTHNTKSRNAKRLFGSYSMRTAMQAAFLSHYRCQHCGEQIACQASSQFRVVEADPDLQLFQTIAEVRARREAEAQERARAEAADSPDPRFKRRRPARIPEIQPPDGRRANVVLHSKVPMKRG